MVMRSSKVFRALHRRLGGQTLRPGSFDIRLGNQHVVGAVLEVVHADRALIVDAVHAVEHVLHLGEVGLLQLNGGLRHRHVGPLGDQLGHQLAIINLHDRLALLHHV